MSKKQHWSDIAMSIYDRIQANPRLVALYRDGSKVKTSNHGSVLFEKVVNLPGLIGIYDKAATLDDIEADILDAMA